MRQVSYSYVSFLVMQLINYVVNNNNNNNNNNRVRYLQNNQNILQQNQDIMFDTINNMIGKVGVQADQEPQQNQERARRRGVFHQRSSQGPPDFEGFTQTYWGGENP